METKKMFFNVDANQIIDFKPILKKEFLELKMKAISTANPNRNNSWFTRESLEKAKESFRGKPILGYFENGDFVSHNGEWKEDEDTGMDYWDTYTKKGERILGFIREKDELEIVEDENGLSWICFSCALWVQYNFKQVKRLLQDAVRAKKYGGATKNISVEVDITDYEELENGIIKINDFNLVGVTILGSRNGVKVEPGIEGAELSVVDIPGGKELFEQQSAAKLRLAYEKKLGDSDTNIKEEFSKVKKENVSTVEQPTEALATAASNETGVTENFENAAATNTEETSTATTDETNTQAPVVENDSQQNFEDDANKPSESNNDNTENFDCGAKENEEEVCPECGKSPCECESKKQNESCDCAECSEEEHQATPEETISDLAWMVSDMCWNVERMGATIAYYEKHEEAIGRDYILPVLRRMLAQAQANEKELAEVLSKVTNEYVNDEKLNEYEAALVENYDCKKLYDAYNTIVAEKAALEESIKEKDCKLAEYSRAEFLKSAKELIQSANLDNEISNEFYSKCESGEISSLDVLKTQVALYCFDNKDKTTFIKEESAAEVFEGPVSQVNTATIFKEEKAAKVDKWTALRNYRKE